MKRLYRWTVLVIMTVMLGLHSPVEAEQIIQTHPDLSTATGFRFISWGDGQDEPANLRATANQAAALTPAFAIFNGDLEQDGVRSTEMNSMTTAMGALYGKTFLIRGNHDDHVSGSSNLWENYFTMANRPLPAGISNYTALNSSATYLTYSFDYGNSRFIGVDVPGDADLLNTAEVTFLNSRLTDAEVRGLTHAFIFFHGPEYCIANHCSCSTARDGSCTPANIVSVLNKHPIISATFHGHEHILGWVHMDSTRVPSLTRSYEEFFTSPAGGYTNRADVFPARVNYYYPETGYSQGFAAIDVNGSSFTFKLYKTGTLAPVFSKTFTKPGVTVTTTFRSVAAYDGQISESSETSGVGGVVNAAATSFRLGDDAFRRQYRSILSFNTAGLPDNAVIKSVTLKIKQAGASPANPYSTLGNIVVDIKTGAFSGNITLQAGDFQATSSRNSVMTVTNTASSGWYSKALSSTYFGYINKMGVTQVRLHFATDDNNNGVADYLAFYSGNSITLSDRPALVITYSVP